MKTWLKIVFIIVALALLSVLVFTAASDKIFFVHLNLNPDTVVYSEPDGGYKLPLYSSGTAVTVASIYHRVGQQQGNLLPIFFEVIPHENYVIDTMHLELDPVSPPTAVSLQGAESGAPVPYTYQRHDSNSSVILDFPELSNYSQAGVAFTFWLDLGALDPSTPGTLYLNTNLTAHENSVFKLVQYSGKIAIQIAIPR